MSDNTAKLEKIKQQIEAAAAADIKRITEDAEKRAKAMIDEESERIGKEQNSAMLSKMSRFESDERKRVSESKYAADRKVLLHRNSLVDGLFADIRKELTDFAASDKYEAHLTKCAECADKQEKLGEDTIVYCRKADMEAAEKILKKYGVKTGTDRNITLGGLIFKYPEKGLFIDLTLDSAFEAEREAFSARSEMQL